MGRLPIYNYPQKIRDKKVPNSKGVKQVDSREGPGIYQTVRVGTLV